MPHITETQLITYQLIISSGVKEYEVERIMEQSELRGEAMSEKEILYIRKNNHE